MIIVKNRELLIPNHERYIGTTYDNESEMRLFQIPRFSQNGVDLSALTFRLDLKYANNAADTVILTKEVTDLFIYATWEITNSQLQVPGTLYIGIRATDNEATVKWTSFTAAIYVDRHLNTPGSYTGDLTEIAQMEQDHQYMLSVVDELRENLDYRQDAEAWAVGKRLGEDVPETDETYHNNSKYYKDQSDINRQTSEAYAKGTVDGVAVSEGETGYHDNAKYYSELASDSETNAANTAAIIAASRNQISANTAAISSEASARLAQDSSLQSQINQLVAPTGSAPSAAEVQNARVGEYGVVYDTLGNAIRGQVADLRDDLEPEILRENLFTGWKQGYYAASNGNYDANHNNYVCTISPMPFTFEDIIYWNVLDFPNLTYLYVNCYDSNMAYIGSVNVTSRNPWYGFDHTSIATYGNVAYINLSIGVGSNTVTPSTALALNIYRTPLGTGTQLLSSIKNTAPYHPDWSNRIFHTGDKYFVTSANRIGLREVIKAESPLTISVEPGYKYAVLYFSEQTASAETLINYVGWITTDTDVAEGEYFLINLAASNDANITPTESVINALKITPNYLYTNDLSEEKNVVFSKGTLNADGTTAPNGNGVYTQVIGEAQSFYIAPNSHAVMLLYNGDTYLGKINSSGGLDQIGGSWYWFNGNNDITSYLETFNANAIRLCVVPTDSTEITTETAQSWGEAHCSIAVNKFVSIDYADSVYAKKQPHGNNYIIASDLMKKYINIDESGTLTYPQAFCRYNGKYYSIDGSNIAEQDSSFNVLRNVPLNTGHGNALQLGSGGIAYASGWNDNKIYAVNLNNLTIDSVITLPTTGYTTGAVDETKGLAYIFQRDSYPDHEDNYHFIVYDINNDSIISTKKILAYGAMQACDLFNDRIIVINGLGNQACPNGYRIFDTNGNILADYYLGNFSTTEPEGVCIDRDNHELLISLVNKKLYKLLV